MMIRMKICPSSDEEEETETLENTSKYSSDNSQLRPVRSTSAGSSTPKPITTPTPATATTTTPTPTGYAKEEEKDRTVSLWWLMFEYQIVYDSELLHNLVDYCFMEQCACICRDQYSKKYFSLDLKSATRSHIQKTNVFDLLTIHCRERDCI